MASQIIIDRMEAGRPTASQPRRKETCRRLDGGRLDGPNRRFPRSSRRGPNASGPVVDQSKWADKLTVEGCPDLGPGTQLLSKAKLMVADAWQAREESWVDRSFARQ